MTRVPLGGLQLRREQSPFNRTELAAVTGVSQSHYCKIENGAVRLDIHRAAKLAAKLGCRIEELI